MKLPFPLPPEDNNVDISNPCSAQNSIEMTQPSPAVKSVEIRLPCPGDDISRKPVEVKTINMNDLASQPDLKCLYCDVVVNQRKDYFKHLKVIYFLTSFIIFKN